MTGLTYHRVMMILLFYSVTIGSIIMAFIFASTFGIVSSAVKHQSEANNVVITRVEQKADTLSNITHDDDIKLKHQIEHIQATLDKLGNKT